MIKRIRICNFKSLGDVTVDLEPITALIGCSGTGKTNFVEALRFLRDFLRTRNLDTILHSTAQRSAVDNASNYL